MEYPVVIYDNLCTSCTSYAKVVNKLLHGRITMLGHYTTQGKSFKQVIFPDGYDGADMSWFVTEKKAYGGREGLKQLIKYGILNQFTQNHKNFKENNFHIEECTTDCRTVKGVMIRSCSILTTGKVIEIN